MPGQGPAGCSATPNGCQGRLLRSDLNSQQGANGATSCTNWSEGLGPEWAQTRREATTANPGTGGQSVGAGPGPPSVCSEAGLLGGAHPQAAAAADPGAESKAPGSTHSGRVTSSRSPDFSEPLTCNTGTVRCLAGLEVGGGSEELTTGRPRPRTPSLEGRSRDEPLASRASVSSRSPAASVTLHTRTSGKCTSKPPETPPGSPRGGPRPKAANNTHCRAVAEPEAVSAVGGNVQRWLRNAPWRFRLQRRRKGPCGPRTGVSLSLGDGETLHPGQHRGPLSKGSPRQRPRRVAPRM